MNAWSSNNYAMEIFDDSLTIVNYSDFMNKMAVRKSNSYLLRLWAEEDDGEWVWRISIIPVPQVAQPRQPIGFSSLNQLMLYLQTELNYLISA